jgi:hypothetical protein
MVDGGLHVELPAALMTWHSNQQPLDAITYVLLVALTTTMSAESKTR